MREAGEKAVTEVTTDEFEDSTDLSDNLNLRQRYPQSFRYVIQRSLVAVALFLACAALLFFMPLPVYARAGHGLFLVLGVALLLVMLGCTVRFLYDLTYYWIFSYSIQLDHFSITRGVLFRSRMSLPIAKINDVTIKRGPIELMLQLYRIEILTGSALMGETVQIPGLSRDNAAALQKYLLALVETTLPVPDKVLAERVVAEAQQVSPQKSAA